MPDHHWRKPAVEIGSTYGRLTVIEHVGSSASGKRLYRCQCDCGNQCDVIGSQIKSGQTTSCGCLALERRAATGRLSSHGRYVTALSHVAGTPEHNTWTAMVQRCTDPNHRSFQNYYGGRGIAVCARWSGPDGFANFAADMGTRPEATTLDRIDVDGDYGPGNCRWATAVEQARNRQTG